MYETIRRFMGREFETDITEDEDDGYELRINLVGEDVGMAIRFTTWWIDGTPFRYKNGDRWYTEGELYFKIITILEDEIQVHFSTRAVSTILIRDAVNEDITVIDI